MTSFIICEKIGASLSLDLLGLGRHPIEYGLLLAPHMFLVCNQILAKLYEIKFSNFPSSFDDSWHVS